MIHLRERGLPKSGDYRRGVVREYSAGEPAEYPGDAQFKQARYASDDANRNPLGNGERHRKAEVAFRRAANKLRREGHPIKAAEAEREAQKHAEFLKDNRLSEARRRTPPRAPFVPDTDEAVFTDPASIERFIERELDKHGESVRDNFRSAADDAAKLAAKYESDVRAQDRAYPGAGAGKEFAAKAALVRQSEAMLRKAAKGTVAREAPSKKMSKAKAKKKGKR